MKASEIIQMWMDDEAKSLKSKLTIAKKAQQFSQIERFHDFIKMREELVSVAKKRKKKQAIKELKDGENLTDWMS